MGRGLAPKPCLALIHGLGDEADSFRHLVPLLSPQFRVLAPDLPGFGRSRARDRVSLDSCARALEALFQAEAPAGLILVGSSLGASLSQLVAMRGRCRVQALVLVDGGLPAAPGSGGGVLLSILPFLGEARYRSLRGRPGPAYESLRPYYAQLDVLPEADRAFLARRVVERVESPSQMRAYFSLLRSLVLRAGTGSRAFASFLSTTPLPLLILWGREDGFLPPASLDYLAGLAPRAKRAYIEEAGHLPAQERPEATAAAIRNFLTGLAASRL